MIRVTTLMAKNQDAKSEISVPVNDGVREICQRVCFPTVCRRRSNARMLFKQPRDTFEFGQETPGKSRSGFGLVEPYGIRKVFRGEPVDRPTH